MGCLFKAIKILLVIVLVMVGLSYYAVFHTALPVRAVFGVVESVDSNWAFGDVRGSMSKGFTVEDLSYTHPEDPTRVSSLKRLELEYEKTSEALIVSKLRLDSAHFYLDSASDSWDVSGDDSSGAYGEGGEEGGGHAGGTASSPGDDSSDGDTSSFALGDYLPANWIVKSIEINDLTIEDSVTREKTRIDKFESDGFMYVEDRFLLGRILLHSNNVDVGIFPTGALTDGTYGTAVDIKARIGEKLHWALKKDIHFTGSFDFTEQPVSVTAFEGLGGAVRIRNRNNTARDVSIRDFSFDDYFVSDSVPPVRNLTLDAVYRLENGEAVALDIARGSFTLGGTTFTIKRTSIDLTDNCGSDCSLEAQGASSGIDYTITSEDESVLHFSSEPHMSEEDILSTLTFGKPFSGLTPEQQEQISNWLN